VVVTKAPAFSKISLSLGARSSGCNRTLDLGITRQLFYQCATVVTYKSTNLQIVKMFYGVSPGIFKLVVAKERKKSQ